MKFFGPRFSRFALLLAGLSIALPAIGQTSPPTRLLISQVYGGGGNSGAQYTNDFVELYNPTAVSINLNGFSVQYASATGTSWTTVALPNSSIPSGHFFLIQMAAGTASPAPLPTPDASATGINMSATAGKVAIVSSTTALTGACPASSAYIDLVGFGTTANCHEGSGNAPAPSNTTADVRANLNIDYGNNATDYTTAAPAPRNSASPGTGGGGTASFAAAGSANPSAVYAGNPTVLSVTVTPVTGSTGITVTGDLRNIGGSQTQAFANPSGDGVTFTYTATVGSGITGSVSLPITAADAQSHTASTSIALTVSTPPATVAIDVIQGHKSTTALSLSPYAGQKVTTNGIVTAVLSNGFFIQTPDNSADTDLTTPEGIDVFTSTAPTVHVGDAVQVIGTVQTYPATTASHTPATEIATPTVSTLSTGNALPAPILLTTDLNKPNTLWQFTPYEGMRVTASLTTTSGTDGNLTESSETIASNGQFYAVITGTPRPFREPGIDIRDSFASQPANVAHFDDNPERILVDSDLAGGSAIEVSTGAVLANATGVLDFTYSSDTYYDPSRLILDASYNRANVTPGITTATATTTATYPIPTKASNEFTVASYNIERFYNTLSNDDIYAVPSPATCFSGDAQLTASPLTCKSEAVDITSAAYTRRLQKLSLAIRNVLNLPDVVTLEEIENQTVANDIANQLNADIGTATGTAGQYVGLSTDNQTYYSNDGTGISVGFLYNAATVDKLGFSQFGQGETFTPSSGNPTTLNDRPWLVLNAGIKRSGAADYPVTVIVNHMKSLINQNSTTSNSTRLKKELQAEDIAKYIQTLQQAGKHVISGGDFNAFEFADGYNDTLGTYTNVNVQTANLNTVVQPGVANLVTPALTDLALTIPTTQRWSYQESGSAQILDHMVVTSDLLSTGVRFAYAHNNADFPLTAYNDATTPARTSDHDPAIGYFIIPAPVLSATLTPASANFGSSVVGSSTSGQVFTFTNTGEAPVNVAVSLTGDFSYSTGCGSTLAIGSSCNINVVFTPTATGSRTGTLTVTSNTSAGTYTSTVSGTGTGSTAQSITFPQPATPVTVGSSTTLTATSNSGLPVVYSITSGSATISGSVVTYTGSGNVVIAANQPGNASYAAAATVSNTVTVSPSYVWLLNATGTLDQLATNGTLVTGPVGNTTGAGQSGGVAFDAASNVWSVTSASNALDFVTRTGVSSAVYTGGGLNAPAAVAVDGAGLVWVANSGAGSVSAFTNAGAAITTSPAISATAPLFPGGTNGSPSSVVIDNTGGVWVANKTSNSVTHIVGAATPVVTPLSGAVTNGTVGVKP